MLVGVASFVSVLRHMRSLMLGVRRLLLAGSRLGAGDVLLLAGTCAVLSEFHSKRNSQHANFRSPCPSSLIAWQVCTIIFP